MVLALLHWLVRCCASIQNDLNVESGKHCGWLDQYNSCDTKCVRSRNYLGPSGTHTCCATNFLAEQENKRKRRKETTTSCDRGFGGGVKVENTNINLVFSCLCCTARPVRQYCDTHTSYHETTLFSSVPTIPSPSSTILA